MEVEALCTRLWLNVLMLFIGLAKQCYPLTSDTAVQIVPSKLQFFEYEPVSFTCEGLDSLTGWRVRSMNETLQKCSNDTITLTVTCTIEFAYEPDSGEYWCEGRGSKSNNVSITVTSGSVILESPVVPLTEGDSLTLRCRTRFQDSSNFTADFYKDGVLLQSSNTRQMTVGSVNKSDEGLYKCSIARFGMSPESWVAIRATSDKGVHFSHLYYTLLRLFVMLVLLLLLIGLLYWKKQLGKKNNLL